MLRRVQCRNQILFLGAAVVVVLAAASCGGGFENDSVTGVSVMPEASTPPEASGPVTFTTQGRGEGHRHGGDHKDGEHDRTGGERDRRRGDDRGGADCQRGGGNDGGGSRGQDRVLICHDGREKWVDEGRVERWLRLGATLGGCPAAVSCPCFSVDDIEAAASQCSTTVTPTCSVGNPYYLFLGCEAGGSVPPSVLGVYLTQVSDGGYCERNDVFGSFSQTGLTPAEYQACVDEIGASGYCS
jgi:hypothetical protein